MIEWSNVEKIGGILCFSRSPACSLQRFKEWPVDVNDLLNIDKGVGKRGEDFCPIFNDAAGEKAADKVEEESSNGRQGEDVCDKDQVEGGATA